MIGQQQLASLPIDDRDRRLQLQVDRFALQPLGAANRQRRRIGSLEQEFLRQRRTVVGRLGFGSKHGDRPGVFLVAQRFGHLQTGLAGADNHKACCHLDCAWASGNRQLEPRRTAKGARGHPRQLLLHAFEPQVAAWLATAIAAVGIGVDSG